MTAAVRHSNRWWLVSLLLVWLTACSSRDEEVQEAVQPEQEAVLTFYVYAPERPMITRAVDDVAALDAENAIHSLQIWVFETGTNSLVGYLNPDVYPTNASGVEYQMKVSQSFANAATKPNVDVYVVANAASVGLSSLGESTPRTTLEAAMIGSEHFGVGAPVSKIQEDKGLPMSGVQRNLSVAGELPVLRIEKNSEIAKVNLMRAVSKMRYVFSRKAETTDVYITSITIDGNMIPVEEYVFLTDRSYRIGGSYEPLTATLLKRTTTVNESSEPMDYVYTTQTSQEYETLIDAGVAADELTQVGPFYFKETDKKINGIITYKVGSSNAQTVPFYMTVDDVNKRFVRNHSWIVYGYFNGAAEKPIITVWVDTNWQTGDYFTIDN